MKVRFIFHKGKDSFVGKAIVAWTWVLALFSGWKRLKDNYSHVEIWFQGENGEFYTYAGRCRGIYGDLEPPARYRIYLGDCFSSTTRGKWKGVRFAPASEVLHHPERWDWIEAEITEMQYQVMFSAAEGEVGKKYDYLGIFTGFFMLASYLQNDDERYCSGLIQWLAWIGRIFKKRIWIISPRRLARKLAEKYGEPKTLI